METKRLTALLLMLCMVICLLPPTQANAATVASGPCGENVTATLDDNGTLTISGTGHMYDGILIPTPATNEDIKKVIIEPGVQSIGALAFAFYTNMTEISIPDSVTFIGSDALYQCRSLKTVIYNKSFASWKAKEAFADAFDRGYTLHCTDGVHEMCGFKTEWSLDDQGTLTIWGEDKMMDRNDWDGIHSPWDGIDSIQKAIITDGVTNIGSGAFFVCKNLQTVTIPDSVTSIGVDAFFDCENLSKIRLTDKITSIDENAFGGCHNLLTVEYTGTFDQWKAQDFHSNAFAYAYNLTCVDGTHQMCGTDAYWILDSAGNLRIMGEGVIRGTGWTGNADRITRASIAPGLTIIGNSTFENCTALVSVEIPETVTLIDWYAFSGCNSLAAIHIPNSITCIESGAFDCCTSLVSVDIPDSITYIGDYVFFDCTSLSSIRLPDEITVLGDSLFSGCSSLTEIHLPEKLETISIRAFERCTALESITLPTGLRSIGIAAFSGCANLREITIPRSIAAIEGSAFQFCHNLTDVNYDGTLANWTSVTLDENVFFKPIRLHCTDGTYQMCGSSTSWNLDQNGHLEVFGAGVIIGVQNGRGWMGHEPEIYSVTIHKGITGLGEYCFSGCTNLQEVQIPEGVTFIASSAFQNCTNLSELALPEGLLEIYNNAFTGCRNLKSIAIPASVTKIGWYAFSSCTQLADIYYGGTPEQWNAIEKGDYNAPLESATIHYNHEHSWQEATCTESRGCTVCGATEGSALGHAWQITDCASPKICSVCKVSSGKPAGHTYDDGVDGTCNVCSIHRETTENRTVMHMFRMYDPNSGEHFYTGSTVERQNLIDAGWQYEGVGFTFSRTTGSPVYRLYDPVTGEHLYTMDSYEKDTLMAQGWNMEGIAFNSAYDTEVPQYRLHNPNATRGAYHFTASIEERDNLIAAGWEYQGIGFYSSWK